MLVDQLGNLNSPFCVFQPQKKTPQSIRDYENVQKRIKVNGVKFDKVSCYIDKYFGTHVTIAILTSLAKIIIEKFSLKLDRLARRNRSALICWYAENWDVIYPLLNDVTFETKLKNMQIEPHTLKIIKQAETKENEAEIFDPSDLSLLLNFH